MSQCECAPFSKSLNPRNIDKSVSVIRIRFPFESSLWISLSGCKLTILSDIQPANRIMIISDWYTATWFTCLSSGNALWIRRTTLNNSWLNQSRVKPGHALLKHVNKSAFGRGTTKQAPAWRQASEESARLVLLSYFYDDWN